MIEVTASQIQRILEVTDRLGVHRERVVVPLGARPGGRVRKTPAGKIEIVVDAEAPFEAWLGGLEAAIRAAVGGDPGLGGPANAAAPRGPSGMPPGRRD